MSARAALQSAGLHQPLRDHESCLQRSHRGRARSDDWFASITNSISLYEIMKVAYNTLTEVGLGMMIGLLPLQTLSASTRS